MASQTFSSEKVHQESLKCTVLLDVQTVTCPGVSLSKKNDIYLRVCIMGLYRRTPCVPPLFPLHFHHKMVFVKSFPGVIDPADVADLLKADTTYFQLIQLVPPDGLVLARVEENSRVFLYPGLRLSSKEGATEREILMKRSSFFPGICLKVKFGITSVIEESDGKDSWPASPISETCCLSPARSSLTCSRRPTKIEATNRVSLRGRKEKLNVKVKISHSDNQKDKKERQCTSSKFPSNYGYQQPTVSSKARALSPYTHRKICQLSEDARQRLSHLQLGPHHFRKETESQPPFLVPVGSNISGMGSPSSCPQSTHQHCVSFTADHTVGPSDSSLLGSYRPRTARSSTEMHSTQTNSPVRSSALAEATLIGSNSPSPPNHNRSFKERFQTSPSYWEQIHDRVQRILQTHKTTVDHKITFDL